MTGADVAGIGAGVAVTGADVAARVGSPEGIAAAEQAMRTEGLMVDPVYTLSAEVSR